MMSVVPTVAPSTTKQSRLKEQAPQAQRNKGQSKSLQPPAHHKQKQKKATAVQQFRGEPLSRSHGLASRVGRMETAGDLCMQSTKYNVEKNRRDQRKGND